MPVKKGDKVRVNYVGKLEDGTEFDNSEKHGSPLEFEVGANQVIPGFDTAVVGMEKGQKKDIQILPKDAYGEHKPALVKTITKDMLPVEKEIKKGMMLAVGTPDGRRFPALITDITDKEVMLDMNHALAGKKLNFEITLLDY